MNLAIDPRCFEKNTINVITMSGGKDSTAICLLADKYSSLNICSVFADTGHEHEITYKYIDYLSEKLGAINKVKADFSKDIQRKREYIATHWVNKLIRRGNTQERAKNITKKALEILHPTGNPFLDLCMMKGRFPSTKARFCSQALKHDVIKNQIVDPLLKEYDEVILWQGVRAQESPERAKLPIWETDADNTPGLSIYRPIIDWTHEDVFEFAKLNNIEPNPLYKMGMSRVGCMPCIHSRKSELKEIFARFPKEIERVAEWEKLVSLCSPRGCSTFFISTIDPVNAEKDNSKVTLQSHGIQKIHAWAQTTRGGRQFDLLAEQNDKSACSSIYAGICE